MFGGFLGIEGGEFGAGQIAALLFGKIPVDANHAVEKGGDLTGAEFSTFYPKEASKHYLFTTKIDVQAQPVRIKTPGWAGNPDKMEDGSPGQPWHCLPFVEA